MKDHMIELFYKAEDFFFRNISKEIIHIDGKTVAYITGVNSPGLNPIIQRDFISFPQTSFDKVVKIYNNYNLPWIWIAQERCVTSDLQNAYTAKGLQEIDQSTAMIYNLDEKVNFAINDLQIIEDNYNLKKWKKPICEAFESTDESINQYVASHQRFQDNKNKLYHFVGLIDSEPVTSLTLSKSNNIARIDDVGTLPAHQGKGYATVMIKYALNKAKKLKAQYCFLEASKAGLSVYKKIGFKEVFNNKIFGIS